MKWSQPKKENAQIQIYCEYGKRVNAVLWNT